MKELLEKCLELTRQIRDIEGEITELKTALYFPRNQVLTGMPKSGGTGNGVDTMLIKIEKLEKEKKSLKSSQNEVWTNILKKLDECNASDETTNLLKYRFIYGYRWKDCIPIMTALTGEEWNENKVYREYRCICEKCTDIHKKVC